MQMRKYRFISKSKSFVSMAFVVCSLTTLRCSTSSPNGLLDAKGSVFRDIVYAEREGVKLSGDFHSVVSRDREAPICIVIHGGGWYKGKREDMESVAERFADQGVAVFNMSYRLAPKFRFPAPILDTKDAIRWVKANSKELGVDPSRLCLFGYSAGAHLSLMAGMTGPSEKLDDTAPPSSKVFIFNRSTLAKPTQLAPPQSDLSVAAIAAGGSPTDLTDGSYNEYYEKFFGVTPQNNPKVYQDASPINYVKKGLPPVFLYHGKFDWVVDVNQSRRLIDKLRKQGVTAEYLEVTFGHVATFLFDSHEIEASLKFIKKHLAKKP